MNQTSKPLHPDYSLAPSDEVKLLEDLVRRLDYSRRFDNSRSLASVHDTDEDWYQVPGATRKARRQAI